MKNKKRLIALMIVLLIAALSAGCGSKAVPANTEVPQVPVQEIPQPTAEPTPEAKSGVQCPLDGQEIEDEADAKLRPIAVMLDNEYNARPQSGLLDAEIVYEFPVEGNITRYMAIYHHNISDKIGPVRSARPYFIDKALEYNAVYVHCGGSPQALEDLNAMKVDTLNDLKGSPCFWRTKDRKMPHNLYTSTRLMREVMTDKKMETKSAPAYFKFSEALLEPDGKKVGSIAFSYSKGYKVGYVYDANEKTYYRTINGEKHLDKESGKAVTAANIIVEKTSVKVLDKVGRLEVKNIGKDRGYLLTGGKLIEIEWQKSGRKEKTVYKDLKGSEITLNKGTTWIQVVPGEVRVDIGE